MGRDITPQGIEQLQPIPAICDKGKHHPSKQRLWIGSPSRRHEMMLRGIQLWGRRHQETPHLSDRPNKTQQSPMSPEPRTWSICESAASTFTPKCKQTCSALLRHSSLNGTHRAQAQVCSGTHTMHQDMPCSLFASCTFKCLAAGRQTTNVSQTQSVSCCCGLSACSADA